MYSVLKSSHQPPSTEVFCCVGSVFASFTYRIKAVLVHVLNMVANLRKHQLIENAAKIRQTWWRTETLPLSSTFSVCILLCFGSFCYFSKVAVQFDLSGPPYFNPFKNICEFGPANLFLTLSFLANISSYQLTVTIFVFEQISANLVYIIHSMLLWLHSCESESLQCKSKGNTCKWNTWSDDNFLVVSVYAETFLTLKTDVWHVRR